MGVAKIIDKMKTQPNGIRFEEISKVLEANGYKLQRSKGSHRAFRNQDGDVITIPEKNPTKAVYVKDLLRRIGEA